jgi:hypothetical protein
MGQARQGLPPPLLSKPPERARGRLLFAQRLALGHALADHCDERAYPLERPVVGVVAGDGQFRRRSGRNCIRIAVAAAALRWQSSQAFDVLGEDTDPLALAPALPFESV